MPQITSYTPAWLSQPNPGHEIFTQTAKSQNYPALSAKNGKKGSKPGPLRTIAHRGTQVFIAVGKEIRWADLVYLKEACEEGQKRKKESTRRGVTEPSESEDDHAQGHRVCSYNKMSLYSSKLTIFRLSKPLSQTIFGSS